MTNAEKYLKDGVSGIRPLLDKCREIGAIDSGREYRIDQMLREQAKPTLTEDERVILRNVGKDYQRIERDDECLWVRGVDADGFMATCYFKCYDHLFKFIKERRRI